ncbi:MAG: acyl-CoA dehydrogenase family protein [Chloroflexi bacterium]|nr:acyl-CoA dehydrogenase family protein [Chloroflexota bacterium]
MDFSFTEEQKILQRMVRDFATRELEPIARRLDEVEEFPHESVRKMADIGLLGMGLDPAYGGSGGGFTPFIIAMEEISRASAAMSTILSVQVSLCGQPLDRFGTKEQKERYLSFLTQGKKLAAFALSEPNAGSDAASIETTATRKGETYVLQGSKVFISCGDVADIYIVFAVQERVKKARGITAFILERGTPGLKVKKQGGKLGIRASTTAELLFDDCRVPLENRLGEEGAGFRIAMQIIDPSRIGVAAQAVGIAQAALDASVSYAQQRRQFGKLLGEFQAIQWMLADMATQVDAARLLMYRAADLKDRGLPFSKESAMAKVFASEAAMAVAVKAVQIYGGYGYFQESPVERYFRDAKITEIYEGTSEVQRMVISRNLLPEIFKREREDKSV